MYTRYTKSILAAEVKSWRPSIGVSSHMGTTVTTTSATIFLLNNPDFLGSFSLTIADFTGFMSGSTWTHSYFFEETGSPATYAPTLYHTEMPAISLGGTGYVDVGGGERHAFYLPSAAHISAFPGDAGQIWAKSSADGFMAAPYARIIPSNTGDRLLRPMSMNNALSYGQVVAVSKIDATNHSSVDIFGYSAPSATYYPIETVTPPPPYTDFTLLSSHGNTLIGRLWQGSPTNGIYAHSHRLHPA